MCDAEPGSPAHRWATASSAIACQQGQQRRSLWLPPPPASRPQAGAPHLLRGFTSMRCSRSSAWCCWYCHMQARSVRGATAGADARRQGGGASCHRRMRAHQLGPPSSYPPSSAARQPARCTLPTAHPGRRAGRAAEGGPACARDSPGCPPLYCNKHWQAGRGVGSRGRGSRTAHACTVASLGAADTLAAGALPGPWLVPVPAPHLCWLA
jgi:hypothetical protein